MKHLMFVSLLTLTLINVALPSAAQTPALQQGVNVQMAVTSNAQPMPAADDQDAWVIAVTADGKLFLGARRESTEGLLEQMKINPRRREQNVYIKADARASFADVKKALQVARASGFDSPVLLTTQHESAQSGVMVPPKGLPILLSPTRATSEATVLEIGGTTNEATAEINGARTEWKNLQSSLAESLQGRPSKVVVVHVDDRLPFGSVAQAIDICQSAGAKIFLPTPTI